MILLIALAVVIAAAAAAGLVGVGAFSGSEQGLRSGLGGVVIGAAVVLGLGVLALPIIGVGGEQSDDDHEPQAAPRTAPTIAAIPTSST